MLNFSSESKEKKVRAIYNILINRFAIWIGDLTIATFQQSAAQSVGQSSIVSNLTAATGIRPSGKVYLLLR